MTHIVVLGAGYSGLVAAKLAARRTGSTVTLVNARETFVERVRMHQLASGQALPERPIKDLVTGTGVEFVADQVVRIDPASGTVVLSGRELRYDVLIYALGSRADLTSVPGASEYAYTVADVDHARKLRDRLRRPGSVAIVGGGLTGIEAATELAETYPDRVVKLVTSGTLGANLSDRGRRHLRRTFARLGIDLIENARVAAVDGDGLKLEDGDQVAGDVVVWTTGFEVSPLATEAGFAVDPHGRMQVDATLRSTSHPDVYAVGDAAAVHRSTGQELRMACATGLPAAACAVRSLNARLDGREAKPLRFRYLNQCISLGRNDALIQFVHADDSRRKTVLTGRAAARYKETIIRLAYLTQRRPGLTVLT
ncbi:FAD-dependent oxidoreductase [Kribbella sp. NPDC026611]|uniref:NAD(P)/FAD-dependent oxidoreductase n=1 Tax=Kribbella sp. NPDC026611 TaxID=3154911 RepID=UPI0033D5C9BA